MHSPYNLESTELVSPHSSSAQGVAEQQHFIPTTPMSSATTSSGLFSVVPAFFVSPIAEFPERSQLLQQIASLQQENQFNIDETQKLRQVHTDLAATLEEKKKLIFNLQMELHASQLTDNAEEADMLKLKVRAAYLEIKSLEERINDINHQHLAEVSEYKQKMVQYQAAVSKAYQELVDVGEQAKSEVDEAYNLAKYYESELANLEAKYNEQNIQHHQELEQIYLSEIEQLKLAYQQSVADHQQAKNDELKTHSILEQQKKQLDDFAQEIAMMKSEKIKSQEQLQLVSENLAKLHEQSVKAQIDHETDMQKMQMQAEHLKAETRKITGAYYEQQFNNIKVLQIFKRHSLLPILQLTFINLFEKVCVVEYSPAYRAKFIVNLAENRVKQFNNSDQAFRALQVDINYINKLLVSEEFRDKNNLIKNLNKLCEHFSFATTLYIEFDNYNFNSIFKMQQDFISCVMLLFKSVEPPLSLIIKPFLKEHMLQMTNILQSMSGLMVDTGMINELSCGASEEDDSCEKANGEEHTVNFNGVITAALKVSFKDKVTFLDWLNEIIEYLNKLAGNPHALRKNLARSPLNSPVDIFYAHYTLILNSMLNKFSKIKVEKDVSYSIEQQNYLQVMAEYIAQSISSSQYFVFDDSVRHKQNQFLRLHQMLIEFIQNITASMQTEKLIDFTTIKHFEPSYIVEFINDFKECCKHLKKYIQFCQANKQVELCLNCIDALCDFTSSNDKLSEIFSLLDICEVIFSPGLYYSKKTSNRTGNDPTIKLLNDKITKHKQQGYLTKAENLPGECIGYELITAIGQSLHIALEQSRKNSNQLEQAKVDTSVAADSKKDKKAKGKKLRC